MPQVTTAESESSLVLSGLDVGSQYVFRVGVDNGDGTTSFSDWSTPATVSRSTYTTLNNLSGDVTLAAGDGVTIAANGSTLTLNATSANLTGYATEAYVDNAVGALTPATTVNGIAGQVLIQPGENIEIAQTGSTLTITADGGVSSLNGQAGDVSVLAGSGVKVSTTGGLVTISSTITESDLDLGGNKCLFANVYATEADLPDAATYHGMFAHVHAEAAAYYAHAGNWVKLANSGDSSGVTWSTAPLTPADPGSEGDIAYNDDYFFVRTSQGWRRTALSAWDAEIVISSQPQNLSLQPGGSGNFTVTAAASDGSTVAYQWQNSDDSGATWDTITGATSATYGLSNVALSDSGVLYRVTVSAANITSVTSDSATLTVANSYDLLTEGGDTITSEAGDQINQENGAAAGGEEQVGSTLVGEAAGDNFGCAVAMSNDGTRLVVGAITNAGYASGAGHVRVFDWDGAAWNQLGADIDGQAVDEHFGDSVSISSAGDVIAVGGPDSTGTSSGTVRVYGWSGSAWAQIGSDIVGEAAGDGFGESVSLSSDGSRVAIGASNNDGTAGGAGHVRVYGWSGSAWSQIGSDIDGEASSDWSGSSVSLSGDGATVAIGAHGNDANGLTTGHTRVYRLQNSAWTQLGSDIDGEAAGDKSGWSVSLSGDGNRVAIGATSNSPAISTEGHVRVFDWTGSAWVQAGSDIDGESSNDQSGWAVSLSSDGNTLAVSAPYNDGAGGNAGHVRIYSWNSSAWVQVGSDYDGDAAGDYLGSGEKAVALSGDGTRFAAGARYADSVRGYVKVWDVA